MPSDEPQNRQPHQFPQPTEQQKQEFFAAIGTAICAWQQIEAAIAEVFHTAVHQSFADANRHSSLPKSLLASRIFFKDQLSLTETAVLDLAISAENAIEWMAISTRCKKLSEKRNILAHSPAITRVGGDPPIVELSISPHHNDMSIKMRRIHLSVDKDAGAGPREMSPSKQARIENLSEERYDAPKLIRISNEFAELAMRILAFNASIQPRRRPTYPERHS
jgi:hypothetical protein